MRVASGEQRFALYYAVLFASIGTLSPFAALWLDHIGLDTDDIGLIVAAPSLLMLITTVAIGRWADGLRERRLAIIICNWIILVAQCLLFFSAGFWPVLIVWTVSGIVMYAKVPITDASALSMTRQHQSDYARIRMCGSIGFVLAITAAGMIYEHHGITVFVWLMLLANVVRLLCAFYLPKMPSRQAMIVVTTTAQSLYTPGILLTLLGSALINASHAMVNTFGILHWTQQGISESVASMAVAVGVVFEVGLMWWFRSLTRNLSARACLVMAAGCGIGRWILLASDPSLPLIFLAQAFHGITFGLMFLASATFISRRVPEQAAASGQGLLAIITTACMAAVIFMSGQLFDVLGGNIYWLMSGMCLVAVICILGSYRFAFAD